jgi:O-methyltransferase involved in polyketide biosynthesis
MYLPPAEVVGLFNKLSRTFSKSEIVFEVVNKRYTQGFWKKRVEARMKRNLGSEAGASYQFGVRQAKEIETYGPAIKVVEEWSYFEDEDIRPKFLRLFRPFKFMTRTQWTIKATIGF